MHLTVGEQLLIARVRCGKAQQDAAAEIGMQAPDLNRLEKGVTHGMGPKRILTAAAVLQADPAPLLWAWVVQHVGAEAAADVAAWLRGPDA